MKDEDCIVFGLGDHWVRKVGEGHYQVLKTGATASTVVATFHFSDRNFYALSRAIEKCMAMEGLMPTEKTITLYEYHELSDTAKEKARDWYLSNIYWPDELAPTIDQWLELAENLGFEVDSGPWWDLIYGTFKIGRGRFYRTFDDELDALEREWKGNPDILSIIRDLRAIHWNFSASIHEGKIEKFEVPVDYDLEPDNDSEEEWDEYYARLKELAKEGAERLEDALFELQHLGLKWLQEEVKYMESEKAIQDVMKAHGWLFHEDGTPEFP